MKLVLSLLVLVVTTSALQMSSHQRMKQAMNIWSTTMAHCTEVGENGGKLDEKKIEECKKCHSGVGNWFSDEGLARGMKCLDEFEPKAIEACGEMMKSLPENNFDQNLANEVIACWENVHIKSIGEKCLKATGGKDMNIANLCIMQHMRTDHRHAEKLVSGENEERDPISDPSKLMEVVNDIFSDGRCIHANEGDEQRITDCVFCFDHIQKRAKQLKMDKKREFSLYGACANIYLAPAYTDCFEGFNEFLDMDEEEWNTPAGKKLFEEGQACMLLKQSEYWFKDCKEAGGEGIDGLLKFRECAMNTTISWVASRRPEDVDMIQLFMRGNGAGPGEGGLITSLV